jgi:hypothetical protein
MATPGRRDFGAFLDLAVFAPLGLALSAAEAVPKLAAKGRERLVPQVGLARVVGQFAIDQACRRAARAVDELSLPGSVLGKLAKGPWRGGAGQPAASHGPVNGGVSDEDQPEAADDGAGSATHDKRGAVAGRAEATASAGAPAVNAGSLAIPSYDSLSAPQVVQRLAGLSREEVEAVRRYEAATRGRRTILARAEQLLS